jgi:tetratricopeptide (TPR) repeat protein
MEMNPPRIALSVAFAVVAVSAAGCARAQTDPALGVEYEAISLLGDTLRRQRFDSATQARMQADLAAARVQLAATPNDPDALIWVGRRLGYLGRYSAAIETFTHGIERFPDDPRMYRHRGHRYISIREFDKAIADFDRAVALMAGRPDEIEPDGQPNARNIPIGSLQSNVWYHLALAHYLKGDWDAAARAARSGLQGSTNADRLVSQTHWLYMALRRAGRLTEATAALVPIRDDFDIIENHSYHRLARLYRSGVPAAVVDSVLSSIAADPSDASFAYGIANWVLYSGDTTRAVRAFEQLLKSPSWSSFGYIAAEADLARLRGRR